MYLKGAFIYKKVLLHYQKVFYTLKYAFIHFKRCFYIYKKVLYKVHLSLHHLCDCLTVPDEDAVGEVKPAPNVRSNRRLLNSVVHC